MRRLRALSSRPAAAAGHQILWVRGVRGHTISRSSPCGAISRPSNSQGGSHGVPGDELRPLASRGAPGANRRRRNASGQIPPSRTKASPSRTKKTGLDFLGFLRPIRGFSMGYEQSKSKKGDLRRCCRSQRRASKPRSPPAALPAISKTRHARVEARVLPSLTANRDLSESYQRLSVEKLF